MRLQVDQTGTAGKEDHLMPGLQQLAGVHAADHSSAEHKNPQLFSSLLLEHRVEPVNLTRA